MLLVLLDQVNDQQQFGQDALGSVVPAAPAVEDTTFEDETVEQHDKGGDGFSFADFVCQAELGGSGGGEFLCF